MRKPRILVVGSFVMDQTAVTEQFPREGQTVMGLRFNKAPGGKGANQAVQAARLGADVTMVGKLGHDSNGEELVAFCRKSGINCDHVLYDKKEASGCSVIIVEQAPDKPAANRIIVISGSNMTIRPQEVLFLREEIRNYDLVMLQLEIPMEINEMVAEYAYEAGVPVMLNSAPSAPLSDGFLSHLTYISPNEHEAADITGVEIAHSDEEIDMEAVRKACEVLREKGIRNAMITLGGAGAAMLTDEGFTLSPACKNINVVDPTAAGDSFVGAFCTGVGCGWSNDEAMSFANHAAAITVSRMGAMPSLPELTEVEEFMKERGVKVPETGGLH